MKSCQIQLKLSQNVLQMTQNCVTFCQFFLPKNPKKNNVKKKNLNQKIINFIHFQADQKANPVAAEGAAPAPEGAAPATDDTPEMDDDQDAVTMSQPLPDPPLMEDFIVSTNDLILSM